MTMDRNEETLSTRDLASPNEPVGGGRTAEDDPGNGAVPEGQPEVYDQHPAEESRRPVDEDPPIATDQRTGISDGEQNELSATQQPPAQARTEASASDQTVDAGRPDSRPRSDSGAAGHEPDDGPAESAQAGETRGQDGSTAQRTTGAGASAPDAGGSLLPSEMDATFQQRWKEIQTSFVDEPRGAVEDADSLVANLMQQLAEGFAKERERLEAQWGRGEDISTEDLRVALQRYRTFFQRLLST
jgi:hypothetical protein